MFSPWLVTVITTLEMTAPDGSVTVPRMVPKTVCAGAGIVKNTTTVARLNAMRKDRTLMESLLFFFIVEIFRRKISRSRTGTAESRGGWLVKLREGYFTIDRESRRKSDTYTFV